MNKLMMSLRHIGLLAVLAMLMGSVAYAEPNEGVCDELVTAGKGLHGLCVAFCEAQDCTATLDPEGNLSFPKKCRSSSQRTLDKYNARREVGVDPPMPCLNFEPGECVCWSEDEIDAVGGAEGLQGCENPTQYTLLIGLGEDENGLLGQEAAGTKVDGDVLQCFYQERNPSKIRFVDIGLVDHDICDQSVINECISRGFLMDMESSILFQMESGASSTATPTPMPTATPTAAPTPTPAICLESGEWCNAEGAVCCSNDCYAQGGGGICAVVD